MQFAERPSVNSATLRFYEQEALRYREIHARPLLRYSSALEQELLSEFLPLKGCVLDIGCGEGRTTRYLATLVDGPVIGADFSHAMVAQAQYSQDNPALRYCVADAQALPFNDAQFNVVTAMTTFNNVPDLQLAMSEAARVLAPGGILAATIINRLEAAQCARGVYFFPYYLYRRLRHGQNKMVRKTYDRADVLKLVPDCMDVVSCEGMRMLPDFFPEYPFNFWRPFFGATRRVFDILRPLDLKLSRHPVIGRFARFHLLIARKR